MRTVSTDFTTAEAQQVQSPRFQVVARPNPEVLDWQKTYSNTGKTGTHAPAAGAGYGWVGNDYPDGDYPVGSSVVTPAGTLIRTYGVSTVYDTAGPIYLNRVLASAPDVPTALGVWTSVGTGILNVTREAISADATRVRLFWVKIDTGTGQPKIVYKQSTNDGATWGAETTLYIAPSGVQPPGVMSNVWTSAVLSSPNPDLVFFIRRMSGNGVTGDPSCNWLELYAFEWTGSSWVQTQHTKPMTAPDIASTNTFWTGSFMFDSAVIDPIEGSYAVVYMDDLAGRPASTVYSNQFWSDSFPVEQIDFAEPEHDEIIAMRLAKIGNKLILIARRTMADSDFWSTQQGVMYYSTDGKRWSDAYYVCKSEDFNWGMPQLWLGRMAIVGMDSIWTATPTPFFGGIATFELDLTDSTTGASVDEPEDRTTASTATLNLLNDQRQWSNHGVITAGGELEIRAGYRGTRRNLMPNPSFEHAPGIGEAWAPVASSCTCSIIVGAAHRGSSMLQLLATNTQPYMEVTSPTIALPASNEPFTFSAWIENVSAPAAATLQVRVTWSGGLSAALTENLRQVEYMGQIVGWYRFAHTATPDQPDRTSIVVRVRVVGITAVNQSVLLDDVQIEEGSGVTPYDDDTIGWDDTEMPTMFIGRLGNPNPQVDPRSGSMALTATDYLDNFKQGVLERTLVYSSTVHDAFPMVDKSDVGAFAMHIGNFEWRDDGTDKFVRATKKGYNTMFRASGLTGSQQFSFQVRVEDIFPHESSWHVYFQVNERWDQLYELRGNNATGSNVMELWKRRSIVRASGHIDIYTTLLKTSNPLADAYSSHDWTLVTVTQHQQQIYVNVDTGYIALDYFDSSPLIDSGIVAFGATIPDDATPAADPTATPPVPDSPYDTVDYRDIRFCGDEVETSVEEFFKSIATMRGFETFVAEAIVDEPFTTSLANWQTIGDASHWAATAGGLIADDGYIFGHQLSGLRHKTYKAQDAMMDVDVILGTGGSPTGEIGFLMRATSSMNQYAAIVLQPDHDRVTFYEKLSTDPIIQPVELNHGVLSTIPNQKLMHFRVVASGHWYTLYCNDMFIATFYSANLIASGYWGLIFNPWYTGSAGTTGYQINVKHIRIPILGLGSLPYIQPGAKLDAVVNDLITGQDGWIAADGRTLRMGKTLVTTVQQTVGSTLWLSGGYQKDYGDQATACRVVSTDADGNQITGVAYSPSLWKSKARPVWRIEQVPDLRNAAECRARAWGYLTDQSKVGRTRSYGVHPQLRWQRFDLLSVTNYLDDTAENLYVLGTSRNWVRDPKSGVVTLSMNARLEEQVGDTLDQSTYYPP